MSVACLAAVCWAAVRCWGSRRRETLNPQGLGLRSVVSRRRRAQRMGMTMGAPGKGGKKLPPQCRPAGPAKGWKRLCRLRLGRGHTEGGAAGRLGAG